MDVEFRFTMDDLTTILKDYIFEKHGIVLSNSSGAFAEYDEELGEVIMSVQRFGE